MIKLGKESRLLPSEVVEKAVAFFGPSGLGMKVVDRGACCARFEGAGGHVYVQTADIEGERGSKVSAEGREWEYQIRQFMAEI